MGMQHWVSCDDGGDEGEDESEFVAIYGDGAGVIMVFEEVGLVKGPQVEDGEEREGRISRVVGLLSIVVVFLFVDLCEVM